MDEIQEQFNAGADAYWSGEVPDLWERPEARAKSPYLTGWYMASMWEVQPGWVTDEFGVPLQNEDNF